MGADHLSFPSTSGHWNTWATRWGNNAEAQRRRGRKGEPLRHENESSREIVDAAVRMNKMLGPGLLESVCEVILA